MQMAYKIFMLLVMIVITGLPSTAIAQDESSASSLIFSWKTGGSESLLAKKATAIKSLKKQQGTVISFGALLGKSRIVEFDNGAEFIMAAKRAGIDYLIPCAEEFMFGKQALLSLALDHDTPTLTSANIVDEKTRKHIFEPFVECELQGLRACIIPMSDADIIKNAQDENVAGLDVISFDQALEDLSDSVKRVSADIFIVTGRMDRSSIMDMAVKFDFIDMYVTNNQSAGFSDTGGITSTVFVAGKPVHIVSEASDHLGVLTFGFHDDVFTREFRDVIIGDSFAPDTEINTKLSGILATLEKEDDQEGIITNTGTHVASIFKKIFKADAVLIERQSLYYYAVKDSLTMFDVPKVIKPFGKITQCTMKGADLKSAWEQSKSNPVNDLRLLNAGITADGKVNDIPIQDEIEYTVVITEHLRSGGNGYNQFMKGFDDLKYDRTMLKIVEQYIIEKDELLRKLAKPKIWELNMYLTITSNYNRTDINEERSLYGDEIPKKWREYTDYYQGNFNIASMNNKLTMNKTVRKHIINSYLQWSWSRTGSRTDTQEGIVYSKKRNNDPVELYNKYTYNLEQFPVKPYADIKVNSFLYSGEGKHPLTLTVSSGATRTFPRILNMSLSLGLHGTRDYTTLKNTFGTSCTILFKKDFSATRLLKTPIAIDSKTFIYWDPLVEFHHTFKHINENAILFKIQEKINIALNVNTYTFRNSIHKKTAVGFYYLLSLNYGMNWKF